MDKKVKYKIGLIAAILLTAFAIVADLLQVLLTLTIALAPASDIVTVFAEGFIFTYFLFRRVRFMRGKAAFGRFVAFLAAAIVEMVPLLNGLPILTLDTVYNIHSSRKEDRALFKKQKKKREADAGRQAQSASRSYERYFRDMARSSQAEERELEDA